jgi:hypothetical protein
MPGYRLVAQAFLLVALFFWTRRWFRRAGSPAEEPEAARAS